VHLLVCNKSNILKAVHFDLLHLIEMLLEAGQCIGHIKLIYAVALLVLFSAWASNHNGSPQQKL